MLSYTVISCCMTHRYAKPFKARLHDAANVGSNVGSKCLGQYGANVGTNVGGVGYQLHDAFNSPMLEANIQQ